jgi:GNAT superfamily N-acetyltransferase
MIIRAPKADEFDQWNMQWQAYLDFYDQSLSDDITQDVWQRLINPDSGLDGFVALDNDQIIGFTHYFFHGTTWYKQPYCYLEDLFVNEAARGLGAGRKLIEAVKTAAQEKGAAKLYWHTHENNKTARALYDSVSDTCDHVRYDVPLK